jgi:hypothetical protein
MTDTSTDTDTSVRHFCRNPRCRAKMRTPVENPHAAFCCRGCFKQFYRRHCLVCERELRDRMTGQARPTRRKFCGRKCRNEFRRFPHVFDGLGTAQHQFHIQRHFDSSCADSTGLKTRPKGDRPTPHRCLRGWGWESDQDIEHRLIDRGGRLAARINLRSGVWALTWPRAVPQQTAMTLDVAKRLAVSMALAALPLDQQTATRMKRENAPATKPYLPMANVRWPLPEVVMAGPVRESKAPGDPGPLPAFLRRAAA